MSKHGDVTQYAERWKRLGERLHPHEYPQYPQASQVFEVARGERKIVSLAGRVETALAAGRTAEAVDLLERTPGGLLRRIDHLLRAGDGSVLDAAERAAEKASGRVLLSLREHLQNRTAPAAGRIFVNRHGRAWTAGDTRDPLDQAVLEAAEAFFGFMTRDSVQEGMPFEPRTVRMKSDLRGSGRVART